MVEELLWLALQTTSRFPIHIWGVMLTLPDQRNHTDLKTWDSDTLRAFSYLCAALAAR
jgi:hypothetical protein